MHGYRFNQSGRENMAIIFSEFSLYMYYTSTIFCFQNVNRLQVMVLTGAAHAQYV